MRIKLYFYAFLKIFIIDNYLATENEIVFNATEGSLFWKVFHLLKTKNDLDIQHVVLASEDPDCTAEDSLCSLITEDIVRHNDLIPYTLMPFSHRKHNHTDVDIFAKILNNLNPSLIIFSSMKHNVLNLLSQISPVLISNHI